MGRTACTEPLCLYKRALYLFYLPVGITNIVFLYSSVCSPPMHPVWTVHGNPFYNRYYHFVWRVKIISVLVIPFTRYEYELNPPPPNPCVWWVVSTIDSSRHIATQAGRRILIHDARSESLVIQPPYPSSCGYKPNCRMKNVSFGDSGAVNKSDLWLPCKASE